MQVLSGNQGPAIIVLDQIENSSLRQLSFQSSRLNRDACIEIRSFCLIPCLFCLQIHSVLPFKSCSTKLCQTTFYFVWCDDRYQTIEFRGKIIVIKWKEISCKQLIYREWIEKLRKQWMMGGQSLRRDHDVN